MASTEIQSIRDRLDRMQNDENNTNYYIRSIRTELTALDQYVTSLEDMVNVMSQRLISMRDK